jgi:hypothetical protein
MEMGWIRKKWDNATQFWKASWRDRYVPADVSPGKREKFRITRFATIGIATTLIDVMVSGSIVLVFGRAYAVEAGLVGGLCNYALNFLGHRQFSFGTPQRSWEDAPWHAYWYIALKGFNLLYRSGILYIFVVRHEWYWGLALLAPVPLWNYAFLRSMLEEMFVVFHKLWGKIEVPLFRMYVHVIPWVRMCLPNP